ncbi:hypothetical protein K488DRAFT_54292 [Vararia minispora EC-137]|uniref:Uncharacterized protein n=1 Tax=Vararia minispora EC-137 TaxID=1314806 RepID=A0ACB8QGK0_9AGAM|nr:hypothetical protein K488DRAFT_54292 [Vararia minispora EC-137]
MSLPWRQYCLRLDDDPKARNRAIATEGFKQGDIVARIPALSTALLPSEKGVRCDNCHRKEKKLFRCTGCAAYYYCGSECQTYAWKTHHRHICKQHPAWIASTKYQQLQFDDRIEAILLSHIACAAASTPSILGAGHSPLAVMLSLLPSRAGVSATLPPLILPPRSKRKDIDLKAVHARFRNNNFILHSHLYSFAHGIYPVASRLFNHSCNPSASVKYILQEGSPPIMEIVALRNVACDEEVTIAYVDPALPLKDRESALDTSYDFRCQCTLCTFQHKTDIPPPPDDDESRRNLSNLLLRFTGLDLSRSPPKHDLPRDFQAIPSALLPVLHPVFLPTIAEMFSESSHAGATSRAMSLGQTLLATYLLIYPPNYPQIGMHALEVAKTAWNGFVSGDQDLAGIGYLQATRWYLSIAHRVLHTIGEEGDPKGPLQEIETVRTLVSQEVGMFQMA